MVETLKGRTPVSPTFRPSPERAPSLRSINTKTSLFPSGVTPFKIIEAPRSAPIKLTQPVIRQPNPDRVYRGNPAATEVVSKIPSVVTPKKNLMPAGVTLFAEISGPKKIKRATSTVTPPPKPDIAAHMPKGLTNVRFIDAPPTYPTISKPTSRPMFDGIRKTGSLTEVAKPSRNIFTATSLHPRIIDTPRPKIDSGRASIISSTNGVNIFSREQAQPNTVSRTIKIHSAPRTELRPAYINQAIISPVTRTDTVRPLRTFEKKAELVKPAIAEKLLPTTRTQLKRKEMSTIQKDQRPHKVAIRESLKHANTVYQNFKTTGLSRQEAYQKSVVALQVAMEKENIPAPVIQRIITTRTRRLHLRLERKTVLTVLKRSEILVKSRKYTKKEQRSVKQEEHKVRPIEMILIEDIPTKKLRELIFNQVIENLPGKTATWYDVVRGVMEHPWMPKMNSPLLYQIYPPHIISKYLVDGLLLHRLREWLKIKEPQTKENLKSSIKDILEITPAVTPGLKKPNSPPPIKEETVEIIVKGDKTEPEVERRSFS